MGDNTLTFRSSFILYFFIANILCLFFGSLTLFIVLIFPFFNLTLIYILFVLIALIGGILTYKSLERFTASGSLIVLSGNLVPVPTSFFVYAILTILEALIEKVKMLVGEIPKALNIGGITSLVTLLPKSLPDKLFLVLLFFIFFNISYLYFIFKEKKYSKTVLLWYILGIALNFFAILIGYLSAKIIISGLNF